MIKIHQTKTHRQGTITTPHGVIKTPAFLPDATYGNINHLSYQDLSQTGIKELVTNTLHLQQKAGSEYIRKQGGFHKFSGWDRPVLTDSGGFQVFSLIYRRPNKHNRITDAGCSFIDYTNGNFNFLSPETSQMIQHNIGSDIRVVLDEPLIESDSLSAIKRSVRRTTEWALRSKIEFCKQIGIEPKDFDNPKIKRPFLVAVIQGANNLEYRKISAEQLVEIGFDIYGFGGLPLKVKKTWDYESEEGFHQDLIEYVANLIPEDKIRYGLGMGTPDDLHFAISKGWDIFDTVLPSRNARHGYLYVSSGAGDRQYKTYDVLHIKAQRYENSTEKVDPNCNCECCNNINRNFLRYLFKINDPVAKRLATIHNLSFYSKAMSAYHS